MKVKFTVEDHVRNGDLLVEYQKIQSIPPVQDCALTLKGRSNNNTSFSTNLSRADGNDWLMQRSKIFANAMADAVDEYFKYLHNELNLGD